MYAGPRLDKGRKYVALWVCLFKHLASVAHGHFSGNPRMDLARVHHSGQFFN